MYAITIGRIHISVREPAVRRGLGLRARLALWLRLRRTQAELERLDPRLLADIGAPPRAPDPVKAAFTLDPEPLWGIGLTPAPREDGRR